MLFAIETIVCCCLLLLLLLVVVVVVGCWLLVVGCCWLSQFVRTFKESISSWLLLFNSNFYVLLRISILMIYTFKDGLVDSSASYVCVLTSNSKAGKKSASAIFAAAGQTL